MSAAAPIIRSRDLAHEHAPGRGLLGLSFELDQGRVLGVLGRNGSGKSTLVQLALGLLPIKSGNLTLWGEAPGAHKKCIGFALDQTPAYEGLSGWQNAQLCASVYKVERKARDARLEELFRLAGLWDQAHDRVEGYSYGMRRKLGLIQALCHEPELLILDEPTAGVDPQFMAALTSELVRRSAQGASALIASNDPDWLASAADRVMFLEKGRLCALDTPRALISEASAMQEVDLVLGGPAPQSPPGLPGIQTYSANGERISLMLDREQAALPGLLAWLQAQGCRLRVLEVKGGSLRQAFLLRTGKVLEQ